jgi:hypothetical protein
VQAQRTAYCRNTLVLRGEHFDVADHWYIFVICLVLSEGVRAVQVLCATSCANALPDAVDFFLKRGFHELRSNITNAN